MTELQAREFVGRIKDLCAEYQRACDCHIELTVKEVHKHVPKAKFIVIESISLKIDE
jgi:hypothetical protein